MKRILYFSLILVVLIGCFSFPAGATFADETVTLVAGEYLKVTEDVTLISASFNRNEIMAVPVSKPEIGTSRRTFEKSHCPKIM